MVFVRMLNGDSIEYPGFKGKGKRLKIMVGNHLDCFYFELILLDANQKVLADHFAVKADEVTAVKRLHHYTPKLVYDAWEITNDEKDLARAVQVAVKEKFEFSLFKLACIHGDAKLTKSLLAANARCDPVGGGKEKETPLEAACAGGNLEIVQLLLDIDIVTHFPPVLQPPEGLREELSISAEERRQFLLTKPVKKQQYPVVSGRNSELISPATKFYISYRDSRNGLLALMRACRNRHLPIVRLLLKYGIRIDERWAWSPIQITAQENHAQIAKCLLDVHADPNFTGQFNYDCPLYTAIQVCTTGGPSHGATENVERRDSRQMVQVLLKAKADPHLRADASRKTPFELAAIAGKEELEGTKIGKKLGQYRKDILKYMEDAMKKEEDGREKCGVKAKEKKSKKSCVDSRVQNVVGAVKKKAKK